MTLSSFGYLLKEGGRNIKANRQMSVASIGVLVACMLLIGAAVLFSMNVNSIMGYIEAMNEMVVFVQDDADQATIDALGQSLKSDRNISSVTYTSKEDALKEQMNIMEDAADLLEGLQGDENPLPASYSIQLKDLELLDETVARINNMPGVNYAVAPTDVAATLVDVKKGVSTAGFLIVAILGMVSVIIVSNTIKVTVFNRRKEISIMKYVGATDTFIRIPFLVEGMIIGLVSALLAFGLLWAGYDYVLRWLGETGSSWLQMAYANLIPFDSIGLQLLGGFTAAGVSFGVLGSLFFLGRYLKV
ncbi:permease-like cell division protein FtsX [Angelakisella massiliensis]|uniref:permease-like cell division protein FtsX n=1 Tax=Angelakisella massiliensis TaxID=1871018 RepID=UPI0024B1BF49|nr:permease-like cell division protein FtsX [Angelakisella massiliensis]